MSNHYATIDIHGPAFKSTAWPSTIPELTGPEAERAVKRLYRWGMGSTFTGKIRLTSGNRRTWYEYVPLNHSTSILSITVNPDRGWRELVHDLSHVLQRLATPGAKPHSKWHAKFEARMVREVIRRGWLDGKLKDKPKWPGLVSVNMVALTGEGGPDDESQDEANWPALVSDERIQEIDRAYIEADPLTHKRRAKLARIQGRLERWRKKEARAKKAIAKLVKSEKYYLKALS